MAQGKATQKTELVNNLIRSLKVIDKRVRKAKSNVTKKPEQALLYLDEAVSDLDVVIEFLESRAPAPIALKSRIERPLLITGVC